MFINLVLLGRYATTLIKNSMLLVCQPSILRTLVLALSLECGLSATLLVSLRNALITPKSVIS